jgi:adenosylmethionine-8-amino-7-oxononanoate aminotransferase
MQTEPYLFYMTSKKLPMIERAEAIYMWDHTGKQYIDGCSGAMICNIGYGNRRVAAAIARQAENTFFAYRIHFENRPALALAEKLVALSAPHLNRVFYVSGGSEAVESAMKLCRQYYYNRGEGSRCIFISRVPSYHGCTLGALALTTYAPLEAPFRPLIKSYPKIPAPYCYRCAFNLSYPECGLACAKHLETVICEQGPENVAAFIAEPIGGASTGAVVPPDEYFGIIQQICHKFGIMLILDEVMTGFGRTGKLFGYEHWDIEADIIALSKGMASGYFPLGAIMARDTIVKEVVDRSGFGHGFTYAGNPMACAVGLEVLSIIVADALPENAAVVGADLKRGLEDLAGQYPIIGDVRGRGLLLAIELVADPATRQPFAAGLDIAQRLADIAYEEGLIIYPRRPINGLLGDHLLVAPPLIITADQIAELLKRLGLALAQLTRELPLPARQEDQPEHPARSVS